MSDRYIWAGEIIDRVDGMVNLDDEEIADRLNELDHESTKLNAELTETIAAVSDLMDENADLNHQLAEAYDGCIAAMWSVVMGKASPDTRTAFEFAEGAIRAIHPTEGG